MWVEGDGSGRKSRHGLSFCHGWKLLFEREDGNFVWDMLILKCLWRVHMQMSLMQLNVCCGQRPNYSSLKGKWVVQSDIQCRQMCLKKFSLKQ